MCQRITRRPPAGPSRSGRGRRIELESVVPGQAGEISRDDAPVLLDVAPNDASRILSDLAREGRLETVATTRGPGVRFRMPS